MKYTLFILVLLLSFRLAAQEPLIPDSVQNLNRNFHFQLTTVTQRKWNIPAPYTGTNSLTPTAETASTLTATLFWGSKLWKGAALYINPEVAGGGGVSSARGVAAFTNGEAFRVGDPEPKIYLARAFFQQTINLSHQQESTGDGANNFYKTKSDRYLDIVVGKFSIADYFDQNSYSHDPRSQFFNWGLMSNGAWDYPANVRGYTWGWVLVYGTPLFTLRAASTLVPQEANGNDIDTHYAKANSNTIELEKPFLLATKKGIVRLLGFYTKAKMGNYDLSVAENPTNPSIVATRKYSRTKYGLAINIEQELAQGIGLFARASWNDGKNETWAFTEIDRSISAGLSIDGSLWKRRKDQLGIGTVLSGLSSHHRQYLVAGGYGFIIGDGAIDYSHESVTELYYKANLFSSTFYVTPNYQLVVNPAYNKARGPASLIGLRAHVQF